MSTDTAARSQRRPSNGGHAGPGHTRGEGEVRRGSQQMRGDGRDDFSSRVVASERSRISELDAGGDEDGDGDKFVVPAMPMPIAIMACVLNFILPGFGSMLASLCVFCYGNEDDMTCREKCGACCTVFGIGLLQLLLVPVFLIGWIWSCMWGVTFIGMSASYYHGYYDDDDERDYAWERRTRNTALPTPQVVVNEPYPGMRYDDLRREQERRRDARRQARRTERGRRSRSRISLTPSNLIYPMRAPSNVQYNSPPPPYKENASPLPRYTHNRRSDSRRSLPADARDGHTQSNPRRTQTRSSVLTDTILEEDIRS